MGKRKAWGAVAVLLAAVGVVAVGVLTARHDTEALTVTPVDDELAPVPPATPVTAATAEEPGRAGDTKRTAVDEPVSANALVENESPVGLVGHWTVYDSDDSVHDSEDGWFEFKANGEGPLQRAEVRAGAWQAEVPPGTALEPVQLELGGRRAVWLMSTWRILSRPSAENLLGLEARWIDPTTLRVLDARSRADLNDVEVLVTGRVREGLHPGGAEGLRVATNARSPIALPLPEVIGEYESTERVWARAPGYAWASMEIARGLGGDYVLALRRGGTVRIEVTGIREPLAPFFRLRDPALDRGDYEGVLFQEQLTGDTAFELESVPEGSYVATVEIGHFYRYPRILDELDLIVSSGSDTHLRLDVSGFRPPALVEVRGILVVPVEWNLNQIGLYLELVEEPTLDGVVQRFLAQHEMKTLDPDEVSYSWSFGMLQPGTYEVRFNPLGQTFSFEVLADSAPLVRLEVPPPAKLEVTVVDDRTGQVVEDARVSWMPSREELKSGGTLNGAGRIEPGRFRLTSPAGDVEVWCWSKTHRFQRRILSLVAGHQTVEVRTKRAEGIDLRLVDGETALPLRDVELTIKEVEGDGEGRLTSENDYATEGRFVVPHHGRYRIETTRLPSGYPLPAPYEIEVEEGTFVSVELEVRR